MPKKLIWLASYPKSGNTWLRAFIASLHGKEPIDDDGQFVKMFSQCADRSIFAQVFAGMSPPPVTPDMTWRAPFQTRLAERITANPHFVKTHAAYSHNGTRMFEPSVSRHAVFIVRNPFDVCVSVANHFGVDYKVAAGILANPDATMAKNSARNFDTPLGDWSRYTLSWLGQRDIPMTILRYEDMYFDSQRVFSGFARSVLGIDDEQRVADALEKSDFSALREKEERVGFDEKTQRSERFFWKGYPYHALEVLDDALKNLLWRNHGAVARSLGYDYDGRDLSLRRPDWAA